MKLKTSDIRTLQLVSLVFLLFFFLVLLIPLPAQDKPINTQQINIEQIDYGKGSEAYVTNQDSLLTSGSYEYKSAEINHKLATSKLITNVSLSIKATQKIVIGKSGVIDLSESGYKTGQSSNHDGISYEFAGGGGNAGGIGGSGSCTENKKTNLIDQNNIDISFGGAGVLGIKNNQGLGGNGGGYLLLVAPEIIIDGGLLANGANGIKTGGGGGGGKIVLLTEKLVINGLVSAQGGTGGNSFIQGAGGGGGGIVIISSQWNGNGSINVSGGKGGSALDIYTGCDGQTGADGYIAS